MSFDHLRSLPDGRLSRREVSILLDEIDRLTGALRKAADRLEYCAAHSADRCNDESHAYFPAECAESIVSHAAHGRDEALHALGSPPADADPLPACRVGWPGDCPDWMQQAVHLCSKSMGHPNGRHECSCGAQFQSAEPVRV